MGSPPPGRRPLRLRSQVVGINWILSDRAVKPVGGIETQRLYDHTGFVQEFRPAERGEGSRG